MDTKVKISYIEIELKIKEIMGKLNESLSPRENVSNIVNGTDAWSSKFATEFKKHINQEFAPWLEKIVNGYINQIASLEKNIRDYKKIDRL